MNGDKERRIRERAYDIWLREGQPHGRDAEHWEKAAAEIEAEDAAPAERAGAERPGDAAAAGAGTAPPRGRRAAKPARGAGEGRRAPSSARRSKPPTGEPR